ncbi:MAG TPA: CoA pyrophosphatase [Dehalococcoidia bacterium]|nr:CoA pyrophosphatase [Dehalococcoidia bacterium]
MIAEVRSRLSAYSPILLEETGGKRAAVLVPVYTHDDALHVVLTKRTDRVESHKGEISFPGGRRDLEDRDLIETALREAHEEVGLRPEHVRIIGQLDDMVTISDYHVSAYVGEIDPAVLPYIWLPQEAEVAEILEVPLPHLLDAANITEVVARQRDGAIVSREGFVWREHIIWGATGRMLRNFLTVAVPSIEGIATS